MWHVGASPVPTLCFPHPHVAPAEDVAPQTHLPGACSAPWRLAYCRQPPRTKCDHDTTLICYSKAESGNCSLCRWTAREGKATGSWSFQFKVFGPQAKRTCLRPQTAQASPGRSSVPSCAVPGDAGSGLRSCHVAGRRLGMMGKRSGGVTSYEHRLSCSQPQGGLMRLGAASPGPIKPGTEASL